MATTEGRRLSAPAALKRHTARGWRVWLTRLAWLAGIWLASVVALGVVAYGLRLLMRGAGMSH